MYYISLLLQKCLLVPRVIKRGRLALSAQQSEGSRETSAVFTSPALDCVMWFPLT